MKGRHFRGIHIAFALATSVSLLAFQDDAEHLKKEKEHDARERARSLELVTLDFPEARLSEVLAAVSKAVGRRFDTIDRDPKVRVVVKEEPVARVLESIEDQADITINDESAVYESSQPGLRLLRTYMIKPGRPRRLPRLNVSGGAVTFESSEYRVDDKRIGRLIKMIDRPSGLAYLDSVEVLGSDGKARKLQQCGKCSPQMILIPGDDKGEVRLRIRGRVQWESEYEFKVTDPEKSQSFRVGDFTANYEYPKIRITSTVATDLIDFASANLDGKLRGKKYFKAVTVELAGDEGEGPPKGWCQCASGPQPWPPPPDGKIKEKTFASKAYAKHKPADFDWVKVVISKQFNEPFEGEVVLPAE